MNSYLCILLPSVIGLMLYEKLEKKKNNLKNLFYIYLIMVLMVNFLSTFICVAIFDLNIGIEYALTSFPFFSIKYICLSTVISIVISIIIKCIEKNVSIELGVEKNEKRNKKK